jgi:hypothetical protein
MPSSGSPLGASDLVATSGIFKPAAINAAAPAHARWTAGCGRVRARTLVQIANTDTIVALSAGAVAQTTLRMPRSRVFSLTGQ